MPSSSRRRLPRAGHAEWYVSQVLSLAQNYYNQAAGQLAGSSQPTFAGVCANVATSGYVNPLAHIQNLHPEGRLETERA